MDDARSGGARGEARARGGRSATSSSAPRISAAPPSSDSIERIGGPNRLEGCSSGQCTPSRWRAWRSETRFRRPSSRAPVTRAGVDVTGGAALRYDVPSATTRAVALASAASRCSPGRPREALEVCRISGTRSITIASPMHCPTTVEIATLDGSRTTRTYPLPKTESAYLRRSSIEIRRGWRTNPAVRVPRRGGEGVSRVRRDRVARVRDDRAAHQGRDRRAIRLRAIVRGMC